MLKVLNGTIHAIYYKMQQKLNDLRTIWPNIQHLCFSQYSIKVEWVSFSHLFQNIFSHWRVSQIIDGF